MKALIRDAKEKAWTEFVETLNKDPWARPYQLVMGRLKPWTPPITETLEPEAVERIVAELFPGDDELPPRRYELPAPWRENWQMKEEEMVWAVKMIGGGLQSAGTRPHPRSCPQNGHPTCRGGHKGADGGVSPRGALPRDMEKGYPGLNP